MSTRDQDPQPEGYEPFFGLREAPFGLAPDPRFLFASASHSAALSQVTYALERRESLVVVTGEIGTGKTLLCRTVLQQLERKTFLSIINDPLLERDELLKQLLQDFGVIPKGRAAGTAASRHELAETLQAFLQSLVPLRAHAVVIIDEAQHLKPDVLEQIRLLSNTGDDRGTLLQIILVGQTDLEMLLARPELRQLQQRVSRRLRLEPLTSGEVREYIEHRIAKARDGKPSAAPGAAELARALAEWSGPSGDVEFAPDAIEAILQFSGGLPRVVNLLCDRSLEQAHVFRLHAIDGPLVHMAARALGIRAQPASTDAPAAPPVPPLSAAPPSATPPTATIEGAAPPDAPTSSTTMPGAIEPVAAPPITTTASTTTTSVPTPSTTVASTTPSSETTFGAHSASEHLPHPLVSPGVEENDRSAPPSVPDEPLAAFSASEPPSDDSVVRDADEVSPVLISARTPSAVGPRFARNLALAASAVLATAAIWFGVRATQRSATAPSAPAATERSRPGAPAPAAAASEPEPTLTTDPALPETARTTPTPPAATAPTPSPRSAGSPPAGSAAAPTTAASPESAASAQRFDIVVASFRTDARATAVAAQVSTLGLPVRRRVADGWQQIICGPFPSHSGADEAQRRLDSAGLTGTQIVPAVR